MKVLSRNIYFGSEFKKSQKFFAMEVWSYSYGMTVKHSNRAITIFVPMRVVKLYS